MSPSYVLTHSYDGGHVTSESRLILALVAAISQNCKKRTNTRVDIPPKVPQT